MTLSSPNLLPLLPLLETSLTPSCVTLKTSSHYCVHCISSSFFAAPSGHAPELISLPSFLYLLSLHIPRSSAHFGISFAPSLLGQPPPLLSRVPLHFLALYVLTLCLLTFRSLSLCLSILSLCISIYINIYIYIYI
jgi:hypothetical protein